MNKKMVLRNRKSDLRKLLTLMNSQNRRPMPTFGPLLGVIDCALGIGELDLLLRLGTLTYSYEQALAVTGMNADAFRIMFDSLTRKGFIGTTYTENGEERYSLRPFLVGWWEGQVSYQRDRPEEKELFDRYKRFENSLRRMSFFPLRNIMNWNFRRAGVSNQSVGLVHEMKDEKGRSVIAVNRTVEVPDSKVYPTNSVNDMIWEYGSKRAIGQLNCMCRRIMEVEGDPCHLSIPDSGGCIGFGDFIKPFVKLGQAREISKEEALDVVQMTRDKGAVHVVFHEKDDTKLPQVGMCNCCWDCCGILRPYNMGAMPLRYSSFYMAAVKDGQRCIGCGRCEKFCPTGAVTVIEKKAVIDTKKCLGCGQCVHQCTRSAVELVENGRTAFLPILKKSEARIKA